MIKILPSPREFRRRARERLEGIVDMSTIQRFFNTPYYESYGSQRSCPSVFQILGYVGIIELSEHRKRRIDAHLTEGRCPECGEAVTQLKRLYEESQNHPVSLEDIDDYVAESMHSLSL